MKNILFPFLLMTVTMSATFAQSKDVSTARNHHNNYRNYDMADGKTTSLEKAQTAIDKAVKICEEKQAANDPKLKTKVVAKAWRYRTIIYSDLANLKDNPLSEGAAEEVAKSAREAIKNDATTDRDKIDFIVDQMRVSAFNKGVNLYKEKSYEAAYDKFKTSTDLNNLIYEGKKEAVIDTASIAMTAYSAQNGGNEDAAIELYNQLIDLKYKDENIYTSLSSIYMAKGDADKASEVITKGKENFPESNAFLINEINYLLKQGKPDEAVAKMEEAARLYPDNASLFFALGSNYENLGKERKDAKMMEKAVEYYQKALEKKPDYFDALYNLGAFYYNKAADKLKQAADLPLSQEAKFNQLNKESGDYFKEALPFFEQADKLNDKDVNTLIALKEIHANLGDLTKSSDYKKRYEALKK
ncbi:MAG: tetratricopeptide repeat protein [Chitinophagales bacterium]